MKKRIISMLLAGVMVLSLAACGSGGDDKKPEDTTKNTEAAAGTEGTEAVTDMKIAMVTDYGDITDQCFNQTTYEACKAL